MLDNTTVSSIMTKDVFVLDANDPVREAGRTFRNHHLRHAPVVSNGELVGMLSLVDLEKEDREESSIDTQFMPLMINQVMSPNPVSIQAHATIRQLATLFTENDFHAVPVLDGDRVAGIVTTTDVIRFFLECCDEMK